MFGVEAGLPGTLPVGLFLEFRATDLTATDGVGVDVWPRGFELAQPATISRATTAVDAASAPYRWRVRCLA